MNNYFYYLFIALFLNLAPVLAQESTEKVETELKDKLPIFLKLSFENPEHQINSVSTGIELTHQQAQRLHLQLDFLPQVFAVAGHNEDHFKSTKADVVLSENESTRQWFGLGGEKKLGPINLSSNVLFNQFSGSNVAKKDENSVGGELKLDYETNLNLKDSFYQIQLGAIGKKEKNYFIPLDTNLKDAEEIGGHINLTGSKWFLDSAYQNQIFESKNNYETSLNTLGMRWQKQSFGSQIEFRAGIQHMRTKFNPHELTGIVLHLSAEQLIGMQNSTNEQFEMEVFIDPRGGSEKRADSDDAWSFKLRFQRPIFSSKELLGKFPSIEDKKERASAWFGGEVFAQENMGEWNDSRVEGVQLYFKVSF